MGPRFERGPIHFWTLGRPRRRSSSEDWVAMGALTLLRSEPRARLFFAVLAQSALGTGAAYVALLVIAYERFHSPWAIGLVLLADFLPAIFLGPVLGSAVDRWSRRGCAVAADGIRAIAFVGIAIVGTFPATVGLALMAGLGTALFKPAALAGLPTLVRKDSTATATALYGAITDAGYITGPALAAPLFAVAGPEILLVANGGTFALSAAVLARLPFGEAVASQPAEGRRDTARSLLRETRDGFRATARMPGIRILVAASAVAMFFGGIWNVVELPFATNALDAGASGYSVLVAVLGAGFVAGSLSGAKGGETPVLKRRYLQGLALSGAGGITVAVAPNLLMAVAPLALAGLGNGLWVVHERVLIQTQVPQAFQGRVFGLSEGIVAGGLGVAFIAGAGLTDLVGERPLIVATGVGEIMLACLAMAALRGRWTQPRPRALRTLEPLEGESLRDGARPLRQLNAGEHSTHVVGGTGFWLALLDDLHERRDDGGIELRSGVRE
jgi:MFS family permease